MEDMEKLDGAICDEEPLRPEEVQSFVDVDFHDGTGHTALAPNEVTRIFRDAEAHAPAKWAEGAGGWGWVRTGEATNLGATRVVHVESATSGVFFKICEGIDNMDYNRLGGVVAAGGNDGGGDDIDISFGGEEEVASRVGVSIREVALIRLNKGMEALFRLVQGLLAGLSLATLYAAYMAGGQEGFVLAYQAQAGEFRRAMFLLSTIALAGAEDQLSQEKHRVKMGKRPSRHEQFDLRACIILYVGCLVSTQVCSVGDSIFSNKAGIDNIGVEWYELALEQDEGFDNKVKLWYRFNLVRFFCAWAGWMLVCRREWRSALKGEFSEQELKGQRELVASGEERIAHLTGRHLDTLNKEELQDLAGILKKALGHTERNINLRYQQEIS